MNAPAIIPTDTLPTLIDKATRALDAARTSAEVLEARDMARVAYDAAKSAGRMAKAKSAHDDMIGVAYRMQADAALIEARAKIRLADEYDAAQERGEATSVGRPKSDNQISDYLSPADVGGKNALQEARRLRDAERESPGLAARALNELVKSGQEPTRAALRRSVMEAAKDNPRRPSNRNPAHVKDARRDAVIGFAGDCRRVAETGNLTELAQWRGTPSMAQQARDQAEAALIALETFIAEWDNFNAEK